MSEEKKLSSKTIHVDQLHIKANEVFIHQDHSERPTSGRQQQQQQQPQQQQQQPQQQQQQQQQHIERDFWGFPIPPSRERDNNNEE